MNTLDQLLVLCIVIGATSLVFSAVALFEIVTSNRRTEEEVQRRISRNEPKHNYKNYILM